jgi:hypothetical protein
MKTRIISLLAFTCVLCTAYSKPPEPAANPEAAESEEEVVPITNSNVIFFYEAFADIPSPIETVAMAYSQEYREATNEFAKVEVLKKVDPVIRRKIDQAKESQEVLLRINWRVPPYDFARQGFATGLSTSSFVEFSAGNQAYAVTYKGMKPFTFLPITQAGAATFERELGQSREGHCEIVGHFVSAEEVGLDYAVRKTVYLKPVRISFYLRSGHLLGTLTAPTATAK